MNTPYGFTAGPTEDSIAREDLKEFFHFQKWLSGNMKAETWQPGAAVEPSEEVLISLKDVLWRSKCTHK